MVTFHGQIQPLDRRFEISPSGGGLSIVSGEEHANAYAVASGYAPSLQHPDRREVIGLITLHMVVQLLFGYPNEEAYWRDPRGELGNGLNEIVGSDWYGSLSEYNLRSYGTALDARSAGTPEVRPRHFFIGDKDVSAQALANDLTVETFENSTFRAVHLDAVDRLYG